MLYPVVVHHDKDKDSVYGVTVPDLPGCFSAGDTFEEALENTKEAIALALDGLLADGEEVPRAQSVDAHLSKKEYAGGVWAVVEFDVTPYLGEAERYNIMLPKALVQRIDDRVSVTKRYKSRSGFLAIASMHELEKGSGGSFQELPPTKNRAVATRVAGSSKKRVARG